MKNLVVDLVFWGWQDQEFYNPDGTLGSDAQRILQNVRDVATWV
jgi:hypothetical protein